RMRDYGDACRAAFGLVDAGASAVTFSADDQAVFAESGGGIPVKNAGGAAASGIGGDIVGDVSEPGVILADGMNAAELSFDSDGVPVVKINFGPTAAATPGIQAFVRTADGIPDSAPITHTHSLIRS